MTHKTILRKTKAALVWLSAILSPLPWGGVGGGLLSCGLLCSCSDFFDTDPDNIILEEDYIDKEDEIYKGMLGIINRMQEAGEQAIWLTDTRANLLETTPQAPNALKDICNYEPTDGNDYADPTCYYAVIIACNDYFHKMQQYHQRVGGMSEQTEANFEALISSALRIKVWAYYMLGRIYGEAYWFDDPLTEMKDLSDASVFTRCTMKELSERCIQLLDQGIDIDGIHIPSDLTMQWYTWLDSETLNQQAYIRWQYLTPPALLLRAELVAWHCSYLTEEAAQADWLWVRDALLQYLYDFHTAAKASTPSLALLNFGDDPTAADGDMPADWRYKQSILQMTLDFGSGIRDQYFPYFSIFANEEVNDNTNRYQFISGIMYDYANHQRNHLVQYLCPAYPSADAYYLRPSAYGKSLYSDDDIRGPQQHMVMNTINGQDAVTKYYYFYDRTLTPRGYRYLRDNIFEIQPIIVTFRGHDIHFLLAEAENHLGNWDQAYTILNHGMTNRFPNHASADFALPEGWSPLYASWLPNGGGGNTNAGIVGAARAEEHRLPRPTDEGYALTELERRRLYDWAIADEYLKEYVAEGKSYSYLCKMGERWSQGGRGDAAAARNAVADRIAPKYQGATAQKVRSSILADGYFIQWDLKD